MPNPKPTIIWSRRNVDRAVEIMKDARPVLLKILGKANTCIFCTRVACGVFSRLGIVNRPLPVTLSVCNPPLRREMMKEPPGPETYGKLCFTTGRKRRKEGDPDVDTHGWWGHLVCLVENRLMLDLALDQCNRPEAGIHLEAAILEPPPEVMTEFLDGWNTGLEAVANDCLLTYARLNDESYLTAGDWDREHTREIVLTLADAIEIGIRTGRRPEFHTRPLHEAP
jgi:hypothetical protein